MPEKKDELLPPRPGDKPVQKEITGMIYTLYVNGNPVQMDKTEALGVLAQISNLLLYENSQGKETN